MTSNNVLTDLNPCPFCGGDALLTEHEPHEHSPFLVALGLPGRHPGSFTIECAACECGMIGATREAVTTTWNRRASAHPPQPVADDAAELAAEDVERQYRDGIHIGSGLPRATCPCGFCARHRHGFNQGDDAAVRGDERAALETALAELVDKVVPGLDSGDLIADARTARATLTDNGNPEISRGTRDALTTLSARYRGNGSNKIAGEIDAILARAAAAQAGATAAEKFLVAFREWHTMSSDAPRTVIRAAHKKAMHAYDDALASHPTNQPEPRGEVADIARLDAIAENSWELRCFDIPSLADDADIGWRVIGHHMAEPHERVIAEVYSDDPRAAIDAAMKGAN